MDSKDLHSHQFNSKVLSIRLSFQSFSGGRKAAELSNCSAVMNIFLSRFYSVQFGRWRCSIHRLFNPSVVQSIGCSIHLLFNPSDVQSIGCSIHRMFNPSDVQSIAWSIYLLFNPSVVQSVCCSIHLLFNPSFLDKSYLPSSSSDQIDTSRLKHYGLMFDNKRIHNMVIIIIIINNNNNY